jgi:hypothetical protein
MLPSELGGILLFDHREIVFRFSEYFGGKAWWLALWNCQAALHK